MSEKNIHTIFNRINIQQLDDYFSNEDDCLKYLAEEKWKDGFECRNCGHDNFCQGKKPHSRRCTRCKKEESATAHTVFHRCRIPLTDAFKIAFMVCDSRNVSSHEISRQLNIRQMTCWSFKKKISECLDQREDLSSKQRVELKEIIYNNKELK
jgi:DNA-directed RNA polymerase subunit RPC12/RpoP